MIVNECNTFPPQPSSRILTLEPKPSFDKLCVCVCVYMALIMFKRIHARYQYRKGVFYVGHLAQCNYVLWEYSVLLAIEFCTIFIMSPSRFDGNAHKDCRNFRDISYFYSGVVMLAHALLCVFFKGEWEMKFGVLLQYLGCIVARSVCVILDYFIISAIFSYLVDCCFVVFPSQLSFARVIISAHILPSICSTN